jgi:hypothetical protein
VVLTVCPTVHLGRQTEGVANEMVSKRMDGKCLMANIVVAVTSKVRVVVSTCAGC